MQRTTSYYLLALLLVVPLALSAQTNPKSPRLGPTPPGLQKHMAPKVEGAQATIRKPDSLEAIIRQHEALEAAGSFPRISVNRPYHFNLRNAGRWNELPNGGRLWRLRLEGPGAKALMLYYDTLKLPQGAALYAYRPDTALVLGPITGEKVTNRQGFSHAPVPGDEVVLELYEGPKVRGRAQLSIGEVGWGYKPVPGSPAFKGFEDAPSCMVNVNCQEGDGWQQQKNSVVRILLRVGSSTGWCSGALVNNTAQDCTPYILTALHCGLDRNNNLPSGFDFNTWVFYFNYEAEGCLNPASEAQIDFDSRTGADFIASSDDNGGEEGSDFMLLRLDQNVPVSFNPYYAGWDRRNQPSASGVGIHHPSGDIKKISTYNDGTSSDTWGGTSGTHWKLSWNSTSGGDHSRTAGGSSGSPLFGSNGLIVGSLTGGTSKCGTFRVTDFYGKMSYHWDENGFDDSQRLKPWLDPLNTGLKTLSGSFDPCGNTNGLDLAITAFADVDNILCGSEFTPSIVLSNNGQTAISSFDLAVEFNGDRQIQALNRSLDPGQEDTLALSRNFDLVDGENTLTVEILDVNEEGQDNVESNDRAQTSFGALFNTSLATFQLVSDGFSNETSWSIKNQRGEILFTGGPYSGSISAGSQIEKSLCLGEGCFTLTVFDDFGDGLENPLDGSQDGTYRLFDGEGNLMVEMPEEGFSSQISHEFCLPRKARDLGITQLASPKAQHCGKQLAPKLRLQNFGSEEVSAFSLRYSIDGGDSSTVSFSSAAPELPLQPGAEASISLPGTSLGSGDHQIGGRVASVNGQADQKALNDSIQRHFNIVPNAQEVVLEITSDGFLHELEWTITDGEGQVVEEGGPYFSVDQGEKVMEQFCLSQDCYDLKLTDKAEDGLQGINFTGDYELRAADGSIVYAEPEFANFGAETEHAFCVNPTSLGGKQRAAAFALFPNPNRGRFRVRMEGGVQPQGYRILSAAGQLLQEAPLQGQESFVIEETGLSRGLYFLQVITEHAQFTRRFTVR